MDSNSSMKASLVKIKEEEENNAPTNQGSRQPHDKLRADTQAFRGIPPHNTPLLMMKIITWNIRGLNGRSKQRILRESIKAEKPRHIAAPRDQMQRSRGGNNLPAHLARLQLHNNKLQRSLRWPCYFMESSQCITISKPFTTAVP
jgi:hypothetical protein